MGLKLRLGLPRRATCERLPAAPSALSHSEVALALVERERMLERCRGLIPPASELKHLGQVCIGVGLIVEEIGSLGEGNALTRKPLGGLVLAAPRKHLSLTRPASSSVKGYVHRIEREKVTAAIGEALAG
jgi:hypothetical protein